MSGNTVDKPNNYYLKSPPFRHVPDQQEHHENTKVNKYTSILVAPRYFLQLVDYEFIRMLS